MAEGLHERLLAATKPVVTPNSLTNKLINTARAALRAVVELHAPEPNFSPPDCIGCRCDTDEYQHDAPWPCPTIQAIARELGVDGD